MPDKYISNLVTVLREMGIGYTEIDTAYGLSATCYRVALESGINSFQLKRTLKVVASQLGASGVRSYYKNACMFFEVTNDVCESVELQLLLESDELKTLKLSGHIPLVLGMTLERKAFVMDLAANNFLVAGGSCRWQMNLLNDAIQSIVRFKNSQQVKFVFADPCENWPVKFDTLDGKWFFGSVNQVFSGTARIKDIFSDLLAEIQMRTSASSACMPSVVVIVTNFDRILNSTDATLKNDFIKLAIEGKDVGIHLVISTQDTSVTTVSPIVKAFFPARLVFRLSSHFESQTVIDMCGAETLSENGDALYVKNNKCMRLMVAD